MSAAPEQSSPNEHPLVAFTDADLSALLFRAVRDVGALALVGMAAIWIASGWQSAALFLVGAGISAGGIYESRRLIRVVNAKLDNQRSPRSSGFVVAMFFLRLFLAGAILYTCLRYLHGEAYAIVAGLALAIVALSAEAVLLVRQ